MVKISRAFILLSIILLTGCETSDTPNTEESLEVAQVMDYQINWNIEEKKVHDFPDNADYLGSTEEGFFYCIWGDDSEDVIRNGIFFFQTWNGETVSISEYSGNYYKFFIHQNWLFFSRALAGEDGSAVVGLNPKESAWEIPLSDAVGFPMIYGYEEDLIILSYHKNPRMENIVYKIWKIDILSKEIEFLYQTENEIACVSESESGIFFVEKDTDGQQTLYQYDKEFHSLVRSVVLRRPVVFAVENNGIIYMSERVYGLQGLEENLGGIYEWNEDILENIGWIPFVSEYNLIMSGKKIGNSLIWNAQENGYVFDVEKASLRVLNFVENEEQKKLRHMEDDGFSGIVERNGEYFYMKYTIPEE